MVELENCVQADEQNGADANVFDTHYAPQRYTDQEQVRPPFSAKLAANILYTSQRTLRYIGDHYMETLAQLTN